MRDPDLMLNLLREMAESASGRMLVVQHFGMSDDEQKRVHHIEILSDAGHVDWISDSMVRVTNDGYDFLNAVEQRPDLKATFIERLEQGIPYIRVAIEIVKLALSPIGPPPA